MSLSLHSIHETVFFWRATLCWFLLLLVVLAQLNSDAHVKNTLNRSCVTRACNVTGNGISTVKSGCVWDPKKLTTACHSSWLQHASDFEDLLNLGIVFLSIELFLCLCGFNSGRNGSALNVILLIAHLIASVFLLGFLWAEAKWQYFWVIFLGGILLPLSSEVLYILIWDFNMNQFIPGPLGPLGAFIAPVLFLLVPLILYINNSSTLIYSGWIVIGFFITGLMATLITLGTRKIKKYPYPESVTQRME